MRRRKCSEGVMSVGANSLILLALVQVASGQLGISENEVQPLNMPQITRLDVDCAKTGMTVNIEFSAPFNGVIFSKGFYANPSCRYVRSNSGSAGYTYTISMTDCGTSTYNDAGTLGFENTIIIQMEEIVQEAWDTARRISCDWKSTFEKEVVFNPIQVGMLNVEEVRFSGDKVECWMDIKRGNTPFGSAIDGILEIGEELTVVIYAADGGSNFDILVKNCVAYDDVDYNGTATTRLPLTDDRGCLLKEKLMGYFRRTYDTKQSGASIIAYARLNAFKFPDKMGVFLTCDVELCKDGCKDYCDDPGYPSEPEGVLLLPDRPSTTTTTTTPAPLSPCELDPNGPGCVVGCFPGTPDPECQPIVEPARDKCEINPNDPECLPVIPVDPCQPGNNDPACPPECFPGSSDPRCPPDCFPGSNDPRCPPPPPPPVVVLPETTTRAFCDLNPNDQRCFTCVPGSSDPRCPTQPPQPQTRPPPPPPTQPPPPPPTRRPPPPPTRPPPPPPTALVCGPNSNDPRCPFSCDLYPNDARCIKTVEVTGAPSQGSHNQQVGHYGNKDPMYHSFHKWMYEPAPSRFTRRVAMAPARRKREVEIFSKNATISFTHGFAVISVADLAGSEGDSVHYFESHKKDHLCLNPDSLILLLCMFVGVILLTVMMTVCQMRRIQNRQKFDV